MFRFTIRDVLWLTVLVGLSMGWWLDHRTTNAKHFNAELEVIRREEMLKYVDSFLENPNGSKELLKTFRDHYRNMQFGIGKRTLMSHISIHDTLWLTALAVVSLGIGAAWWAERRRVKTLQKQLADLTVL
jgi:sensor c-di-GMP phosphodiesterase-like protein